MRIAAAYTRFATATDAARITARLAADLRRRGVDLAGDELRVTRVLPRKQGGYTIQYRLPSAAPVTYLCGHLLGDGESVPGYVAAAGDAVISCGDLGLIVPVFPFDPKLKALAAVLTAGDAAGLLGAPDATVRTTVLAYRLEKRCVIRCEQEHTGSRAVAKLVPRSRLGGFVAGHRRLLEAVAPDGAPSALSVPDILQVDERRGAYVMEDVPGASLHELDGEPAATEAYGDAGGALRRLHGLEMPGARTRGREDELAQLTAWTARIAPMFPEVAGHFAAAHERVRRAGDGTATAPAETVLIHGDFYDKQVLHAPGRTTVLDTDNLVLGDAAQDYGNFAAHVRLRQLQVPQHAPSLAACLESFIAGYGESRPAFARRAAWWRSATLLRLAGLYALRPRWRSLVPTLLEEVDSCLNTGAAVQ